MTGANILANKISNTKVSFDTELRCAFAAIVEETRARFHDIYQGDYKFRQQQRPWYDCKDENIRKARKNFEPITKHVSFEEIYSDIALDEKNRYLQKHDLLDN